MFQVVYEFDDDDVFYEVNVVKSTDTSNSKIKMKLGIEVDDDFGGRNFISDPYFKIFDGNNANNSKHITRIKILSPEYVIHNDQIWNLNNKEKDKLIKLLNTSKNGITIWTKILEACLEITKPEEFNRLKVDPFKFITTPMPDYTKLINIK